MSKPKSGIARARSGVGGESGSKVRGKSNFSGLSVQMIERLIKGLTHEEIAFLNKKGNLVFTARGKVGEVEFPLPLLNKVLTMTHNHPLGIGNFGGTFSFTDLLNMASSKWPQMRAMADGQGAGLYVLRKTPGARTRRKAFKEHIKNIKASFKADMERTKAITFLEEVGKGRSIGAARHIAYQKSLGMMHAHLKEVAPKYGFTYIRRKNPHR